MLDKHTSPVTAPPPPTLQEPLPFTLKDLEDWEIAFTRTYKEERELINNSRELSARGKIQCLNSHHECWIVDLYEQLDRFTEMANTFEEATESDRKEFLGHISQLQEQLQEAQKLLCKEEGKVERLKKENAKQYQVIEKLQDMIYNLKLAETEESREAVQRMQQYVFDTGEIEREQERLLSALEGQRAKIERKQRRAQKLSVEEQATKLRVKAAAMDEERIRREIAVMRETGRTTSGRHDTNEDHALDDLWRNI